ncbi:hypothetical protein AtNW77_Chr00c001g0320231 [Arabidopsis thaliana]
MCMIEYKNLNRNSYPKSLSSVSLLEDTKTKTHMDFGYTMKALRSKKKLSSVSLLEDTKPKTHMDFGYTMKALRSKKKVG